jgi:hypothetical protein
LKEEKDKIAQRYDQLLQHVRQMADEQPRHREWLERLLQWS